MKIDDCYKTKDFYLASVLLAKGIKLIKLESISPRLFFFVFEATKETSDILISSYWNRELTISARNLIEAISELKTRIYRGG